MQRTILSLLLIPAALLAQSEPLPKFDAVDAHPSTKSPNQFVRTSPIRAGRYEVKTATMVDLIRLAYGFDADKILGGPSWLELDRFDITGKVPKDTTPEMHKQMLQSALEDRFHLKVHQDTRPLPSYSLTLGKKHQLKEASGQEESGCKPQSSSAAPAEGGIRLMTAGPNGATTTLNLGPGFTIQFQCRNITMEAFAAGLRTMMGSNLNTAAVRDETGLPGKWNFDLKYSIQLIGPMGDNGDRISLPVAIEKQLGLKLEQKPVPTPVLVVDSVNRTPGPNPPETAEALPPLPLPTEFEVATIKASDPGNGGPRMIRTQMLPGGRFQGDGLPLRLLIQQAFNINTGDQLVGIPEFANSERFDIAAKTPAATAASVGPADRELMAPLLLSLLVDRFKLKYHTEERPVNVFALVAAKPKLKKADPESRTWCKNMPAPDGAPSGSRVLACQNAPLSLFADRLQNLTPELTSPVVDASSLEGNWDISLTFSFRFPTPPAGARPPGAEGAPAGPAPLPTAADPVGGQTIFEALEKQLGLKLEKQKRSLPVTVIDHVEQKPTEN